jgi:hypothetical protein
MHNMPIDLLAACVGILAVMQGLSVLLTGLETAAKQIEGRTSWTAKDGTIFEEFAVAELDHSQVMLHDFEGSRGEALLASPLRAQQVA